jgi:hypothetical protein
MAKIIRNTKTLTRITKKGGKVVRRYRKVTKNTKTIRKVKKSRLIAALQAAPSQNLDD